MALEQPVSSRYAPREGDDFWRCPKCEKLIPGRIVYHSCKEGVLVTQPNSPTQESLDAPAAPEIVQGQVMPTDSGARKATPLCSGVFDYFPAALAAVARLSKFGNDKHNPDEPLHWARGKSTDHADCIARHLLDRGVIDPETGLSHTVEVAWRALALLQEEEERERGARRPRGAW